MKLNAFKSERVPPEGDMYIVAAYTVYLGISVAATVWVARTLFRNGRVFLLEAFHGKQDLADSVNHLLVAGFYLINVGYVALSLRTDADLNSSRQAIELLCDKIGVVLLVLGLMHFLNLYIFNALRKRAGERHGHGRLAPAGWTPENEPIGRILE
jgi:hypothetical protein